MLAGSRSVPSLAAGGISSGSTTLLIPSTLTTGNYYLIAKADADDVVSETQESNNASMNTLRVGGDLVVSSLTVPFKIGAGSTIVVSDTTKNQGTGTVDASVTRFYLSTRILLDSSAMTLTDSRTVPPLAAGASSSASTTLLIPSTVATGSYYLIAKADADNVVPETQESNNTSVRAVIVGGEFLPCRR